MAAQVLSGSGNVSYTNATGQNVRLVINYLEVDDDAIFSIPGISINFGANGSVYGKTLGYRTNSGNDATIGAMSYTNAVSGNSRIVGIPLEIALANGDTFSVIAQRAGSADVKGYNIIIIPEAG